MYDIFEQLLQIHNVTAYKVSKETGIGQSTFSDWKTGRSVPKSDKLQRIADYFGVTVEYLLGQESNEKENTLTIKNNQEKELILLCRKVEDASEEDKQIIIDHFKNSIDLFLKAKGLK
jgi:transcriptional regulator with XRE-family HTH domain